MPEERDLPESDVSTDDTLPPRDQAPDANHTASNAILGDTAPPGDDDTDELDLSELDIPFYLPSAAENDAESRMADRDNPHKQVTMPVFHEPGTVDPRVTLPGTDGLDPNPDMPARPISQQPITQPSASQASSAQTLARMPAVDQYTAPNPNLSAPHRGAAIPSPAYPAPPVRVANYPLPQQGRPQHRRRTRRILGLRPGCLYLFMGLILTFCGGITLISGAAAALFIPRIEDQWDSRLAGFDSYEAFQSTFIYDRYGNSLFEAFGEGRRVNVPYERFPQTLINATIAIEDDSFWSNPGIDVAATLVAFLEFVGAEPDEQTPGGSTITQQLVRNVLFDFERRAERSVTRKVEEIILALLVTQRRSKEDILEMYLNEIYYGNLAYGAEAAAQTFFGKNVQDLTLAESALLAGLPQAPASLDPLNPDPEVQAAVDRRWREVLNEMVEEGMISSAEHDAAISAGLNFVPQQTSLRAPHFTVYAQGEFERLMTSLGYTPDQLARGGFKVYTTLDQNVNTLALGAARTQVANLRALNVSNAAIIVLKPLTGEILAMVGSVDYNNDAIDGRVNVATALRQPGSTMKPFTYSAAMERGLTAADVIWDTRTDIQIPGQGTYTPVNYDRTYHGPMAMRRALGNSYNVPAVQTLRLVGVDYLLDFMNRFGVSSLGTDASRFGLSLTLGGGEVTLLELTKAYSVLANLGSLVETTAILCVVDGSGDIVYQYENGCPQNAGRFTSQTVDRIGFGKQVLDPRIAFTITDILSDNAARSEEMGSRSPLFTGSIPTSVKTGTTDDWRDNWTIGYTRNVAIGVWVGNSDGTPMSSNASGLTGAAPIWNSLMTSIYNDSSILDVFRVDGQQLPDKPNAPSGMSLRQMCNVRSLTDPSSGCPSTITEWMLDGPPGIPDADGNLTFPNVPVIRASGSTTLNEISPGVYRALAWPLPENVAASIQFQLGPDDKRPLPPKYCKVPPELEPQARSVGGQDLLFIGPPITSQGDRVEAEQYARNAGLAILPSIDCWQDVFSMPAFNPVGQRVIATLISQPANGSTIQGAIDILGTAQWDPGPGDFYHLYISGGQFTDWTPLGVMHSQPVANGRLEGLAPLPPGTYTLRLAIVIDGGFASTYESTFTVVP